MRTATFHGQVRGLCNGASPLPLSRPRAVLRGEDPHALGGHLGRLRRLGGRSQPGPAVGYRYIEFLGQQLFPHIHPPKQRIPSDDPRSLIFTHALPAYGHECRRLRSISGLPRWSGRAGCAATDVVRLLRELGHLLRLKMRHFPPGMSLYSLPNGHRTMPGPTSGSRHPRRSLRTAFSTLATRPSLTRIS